MAHAQASAPSAPYASPYALCFNYRLKEGRQKHEQESEYSGGACDLGQDCFVGANTENDVTPSTGYEDYRRFPLGTFRASGLLCACSGSGINLQMRFSASSGVERYRDQ